MGWRTLACSCYCPVCLDVQPATSFDTERRAHERSRFDFFAPRSNLSSLLDSEQHSHIAYLSAVSLPSSRDGGRATPGPHELPLPRAVLPFSRTSQLPATAPRLYSDSTSSDTRLKTQQRPDRESRAEASGALRTSARTRRLVYCLSGWLVPAKRLASQPGRLEHRVKLSCSNCAPPSRPPRIAFLPLSLELSSTQARSVYDKVSRPSFTPPIPIPAPAPMARPPR